MPKPTPRTLDDFKADLEKENKTVAAWAREHNLPLDAVYAVLRGRTIGRHGRAREVLLAMGIKPAPMFGATKVVPPKQIRQRVARAA